MKITVEHQGTKIIVDESGQNDRTATIQFGDQNKRIQETIIVMAEQVKKLVDSVNK